MTGIAAPRTGTTSTPIVLTPIIPNA